MVKGRCNIALFFRDNPTGLGSIDFGPVSVVAMGPHSEPLGDLQTFGIVRNSDDVSDIKVTQDRIVGWTRAIGTGVWVLCDARKRATGVQLKISCENGTVPFAFFVKADEVIAQDKRVKRGSLRRFSGSGALDLRAGSTNIRLNGMGSVQVIPLGEGFWEASFLIAFAASAQNVFDFERHVVYDGPYA